MTPYQNATPSTVVTTDAVDLPTSQVTVENSNRSPAPMFPTETELFTDSQHTVWQMFQMKHLLKYLDRML